MRGRTSRKEILEQLSRKVILPDIHQKYVYETNQDIVAATATLLETFFLVRKYYDSTTNNQPIINLCYTIFNKRPNVSFSSREAMIIR